MMHTHMNMGHVEHVISHHTNYLNTKTNHLEEYKNSIDLVDRSNDLAFDAYPPFTPIMDNMMHTNITIGYLK